MYKIGVSTARGCPHRAGASGDPGCIYCDKWGGAAYSDTAPHSLSQQIRLNRERIRRRYKAEKFIVYFQAHTSTFQSRGGLERLCREAMEEEGVVGLALGARPDCLPGALVEMLAGLAEKHYLSIELGLQTLDEEQLRFLARGHGRACSLKALEKLAGYPRIDVCAHLMFGLPGEQMGQLAESAALLSRAGVGGVKLHNLHVLRETPLAEMYAKGEFAPIGLPEYSSKVIWFLEHLSPGVAVHRLNAVASRWEELVAPDWASKKMEPTQYILDEMARLKTWQGRLWEEQNQPSKGS